MRAWKLRLTYGMNSMVPDELNLNSNVDFQELDVSRNRIKVIPQEIQRLSRYLQLTPFV